MKIWQSLLALALLAPRASAASAVASGYHWELKLPVGSRWLVDRETVTSGEVPAPSSHALHPSAGSSAPLHFTVHSSQITELDVLGKSAYGGYVVRATIKELLDPGAPASYPDSAEGKKRAALYRLSVSAVVGQPLKATISSQGEPSHMQGVPALTARLRKCHVPEDTIGYWTRSAKSIFFPLHIDLPANLTERPVVSTSSPLNPAGMLGTKSFRLTRLTADTALVEMSWINRSQGLIVEAPAAGKRPSMPARFLTTVRASIDIDPATGLCRQLRGQSTFHATHLKDNISYPADSNSTFNITTTRIPDTIAATP